MSTAWLDLVVAAVMPAIFLVSSVQILGRRGRTIGTANTSRLRRLEARAG